MSALTSAMTRRGLEVAHATITGDDEQKIHVSPVAILVFAITALAFVASIFAVSRMPQGPPG